MRIWLNDFELNNPANRVYVNDPIEGLDMPTVRTSRGSNTGQHGGFIAAQLYGARSVTINGSIFASDVPEALSKRREIQSHLPIHPAIINVRILDDDGAQYTFDAYCIDFKMPINRGRSKSLFKIELEAPNPMIFDVSAGSELSSPVNKAVPGGIFFSADSPQFGSTFFFSKGQTSSTVTNTGDALVFPLITIRGAVTNPRFTNRATGESFWLENYAVSGGSVTVIDMAERTVTLDGGNAFAYAAVDADWFALVPGDNPIVFESDSVDDITAAEVSWRPGYWGI